MRGLHFVSKDHKTPPTHPARARIGVVYPDVGDRAWGQLYFYADIYARAHRRGVRPLSIIRQLYESVYNSYNPRAYGQRNIPRTFKIQGARKRVYKLHARHYLSVVRNITCPYRSFRRFSFVIHGAWEKYTAFSCFSGVCKRNRQPLPCKMPLFLRIQGSFGYKCGACDPLSCAVICVD